MKSLVTSCVIAFSMSIVPAAMGQQESEPEGKKPTPDQIQMAVQEICPVSGQKLGAHGKPMKVKIGKEDAFLCCKGCTSGKINPKHWATIHANYAKAQGICPVMKKPLPKNPKWTTVGQRIIYVCCPPCIKKIEADPKTYLQKVDELYLTSIRERQKRQKGSMSP